MYPKQVNPLLFYLADKMQKNLNLKLAINLLELEE